MKFPESNLAHAFLDGLQGLEIGGSAHNSFGLNTKNVDYTDESTVFKQAEEASTGDVLPVDIVAPGDKIPLPDESQDFVLSSHAIEHFIDPIRALKEWYRLIKPGGYIFIIAPHKERTFDKDRPRTTLQELIDRHAQNLSDPDANQYFSVWITEDFVELVEYLGWSLVFVQDADDKVGNGFTIVIQKEDDHVGRQLRERVYNQEGRLIKATDNKTRVLEELKYAQNMRPLKKKLASWVDFGFQKLKIRNEKLKFVIIHPRKFFKKYRDKAPHLLYMTVRVYRQRGAKSLLIRVAQYLGISFHDQDSYGKWIQHYEKEDRGEALEQIRGFSFQPTISILTPVFNVDPKWLDKCIESVLDQWYEKWELCLYDDASTNPSTIQCLKKWEGKDDRIKVQYGKVNQHISGSSNGALQMATGEFIGLLDNDDELALNALYEVVLVLNKNKYIDLIYSDEDKLTLKGKRVEPFFKPDWNKAYALSTNYVSHFGVYRKSILDAIGGFRKGYEGAQDYDLMLRFTEKTQNIAHISKVLYHWRKIPGSTADKVNAKDYAFLAGKKALEDHLRRNNISGEVFVVQPGFYRIKYAILGNPKVSIIIPFRDQCEVLKVCVESLLQKTEYKNYEILLVDNQSSEADTLAYMKEVEALQDARLRVLHYDKPFNFSAINNFAAKQAIGDYVLLLNNDTEVITGGWLEAMLEYAQMDDVGAVGAKLYYPNDTIQHVGVVMGLGIASHVCVTLPRKSLGYGGSSIVAREYSAVTGACLLTKKSLYEKLGGLNEEDLAVAYNDVDFCLRVREAGHRVIFTPFAELYHYESLSRGNDEDLRTENPEKYKRVISEREYMHAHWDHYIENDPMFSINLSRRSNTPIVKTVAEAGDVK